MTCEKCRLWSKLQVLGLGTAIRILLTPEDDIVSAGKDFLSRQETIALLNTLNQFANSIEFAGISMDQDVADNQQILNVHKGSKNEDAVKESPNS